MAGHATFREGRFFGSLDGLRAISVVAVIWHHVGFTGGGAWPYLLSTGFHGVTLFFAISGFLITTLLLRERERHGRVDLKAFYMRRSLRIFPLYYAVLAIYVVLVWRLERQSTTGQEFFRNLPYFLSYTSNWFVHLEGRVIFYFAWSLAAEEQFYLVWPTVQRYVSPRRAVAAVVVVIVGVAWAQFATGNVHAEGKGLLLRIVTGIPLAICFGVVLAHALHSARGFDALRGWLGHRASALAWLVALLAALAWRASPELLIHFCAAMLVGACVYREDHLLAGVLRLRALVHTGAVSYGVYLLHMLVRNAIGKAAGAAHVELPATVAFALTVAASVAVATLSFRYFEAPFMRLKQRWATPAAA